MSPVHAHSDHANTDDPESVTIRGPKWRPLFQIDDVTGCVVGRVTWLPPEEGSGKAFMAMLAATRDRYPFDRSEIVWPAEGWPVDADGRGVSVMERYGADYLRAEQRTMARQARDFLTSHPHGALITRIAA